MAIATGMLTAFAYSSISTLHGMQAARLKQQATDLVTQRLEQLRNQAFGQIGHDPGGIVGDPHLTSCAGGSCYDAEPLVLAVGGLSPQIATESANRTDYTLYTYVTEPSDVTGADNKRVTVVAEWAVYGETWSKALSTIVTQTQRGLPLPEFKLAPVGPSTITVNPGATAAFGFQLSNQGAPDQWNITAALPSSSIVLDDGDDVYNPANDTIPLTDHNGDGIVDTGRLEPKQSVVFWVLRDVPAGSPNSSTQFDTTASAASQSGPGASALVSSLLVVTDEVIVASPTPTPTPSGTVSPSPTTSPTPTPTPSASETTCPASNPAPTPESVKKYNVKAYVLHNSGSTSWPVLPLPATDPIPGSEALPVMYLDMNPRSIPASRALPVFSSDLSPANTSGRILYPGGGFTSTSTSLLMDFRTQNPNRDYTGTMVLKLWVKPVDDEDPVDLSAQVYQRKTNGNQAITTRSSVASLAIAEFRCSGFQEVWFNIAVPTFKTGNNTVLGVRLWNSGTDKVRVAYDHDLYPSSLTVVER